MSVDSTAAVGMPTVTMATGFMAVPEIAPCTTAHADTTTVSTCTIGSLVSSDVELCHK